jgi:dihydrofolate synthase/folylpolyglutamate synthase
MNPVEARQYLATLSRLGMRFGLERMQRVLEALGHPERAFRVIHVAGTNGKGSTCAFAASILRQAGLRVGLYTSPHLVRFNERIQIDDQEIGEQALADAISATVEAIERAKIEEPLTLFEVTTAAALWHFAHEKVDWVLLETGLGGRLDATNTVPSQVCAIARIGLDHTALLGSTLAEIAREKAGIFKRGATAVIGRQPAEALAQLLASARQVGIEARVAGEDFALEGEGEGPFVFRGAGLRAEGIRLPLAGPHQRENAELAIEAARLALGGLTESQVREGLRRTRWPGRLEVASRDPLTLLDGAHNPDGARALAEAMRALHSHARVHLVFGVLADKDVSGIAALLFPLAQRLYLASPVSDRALAIGPLEELAGSRRHQIFGSVAGALHAAREAARQDGPDALVLVAGSLFMVGEAKVALSGSAPA